VLILVGKSEKEYHKRKEMEAKNLPFNKWESYILVRVKEIYPRTNKKN
jgi:hypothetical protein